MCQQPSSPSVTGGSEEGRRVHEAVACIAVLLLWYRNTISALDVIQNPAMSPKYPIHRR